MTSSLDTTKSKSPPNDSREIEPVHQESALRILPSGRSVVATIGEAGEAIEIRSAEGQLEVSIALTEEGPVVRLQGAKLELASPDRVSVRCNEFEIETNSDIRLRAQGAIEMETGSELRTKSAGQTFFDGDYVNLNCRDREGYHDALKEAALLAESSPEEPNDTSGS